VTTVEIGSIEVGDNCPAFVIAEIGINHNGDLAVAKKLIDAAAAAGCQAVKFQKRTPEICVPRDQWDIRRDTPWGQMSYMDYRHRIELQESDFKVVEAHARASKVLWFASCWDEPSVDFMEIFAPPAYKIASACLTDDSLLRYHRRTGRPVILSTGMSTLAQIDHAVDVLGTKDLIVLHCTSSYPAPPHELNLKMIPFLAERYRVPVGYSGHETGLATTVAAVTLGACVVERHITLDRAMWGSDQSASVEPHGFARLVRDIRTVETAMGDGVKVVYDSELPIKSKLRRVGA
jgi:sialic acid synthase SpsE